MKTPRIVLRALSMTDLDITLKWRNQIEIRDYYAGHPFYINREMEQKWYEKILTSNIPVTALGIQLCDSDKLIGVTMLHGIDLISRSAGLAILIGDKNERGKGYSKEAIVKLLEFGFKSLGLHRIWLKVRFDNRVAINLYKSIGFFEEGILRGESFKDGEFKDMVVLSMLDSEFKISL